MALRSRLGPTLDPLKVENAPFSGAPVVQGALYLTDNYLAAAASAANAAASAGNAAASAANAQAALVAANTAAGNAANSATAAGTSANNAAVSASAAALSAASAAGAVAVVDLTRSEVSTRAIPVNAFRTTGYATRGDGGDADYIQQSSGGIGPITDVSGKRFVLANQPLKPQMFGAVGSANDAAGVQAWLDGLFAGAALWGRVEGHVSLTHTVAAPCLMEDWTGQIVLRGIRPGAGFVESASFAGASSEGLVNLKGPVSGSDIGPVVAITAAFTDFVNTISVAELTSFVEGSIVDIEVSHPAPITAGVIERGMLNKVRSRSASSGAGTLTFEYTIPFECEAGDLSYATVNTVKLNPGHLELYDLTFTGLHNVAWIGLLVLNFENLIAKNINTTKFLSSGVYIHKIMGGEIKNVRDLLGGNPINHSGQGMNINLLTKVHLSNFDAISCEGGGMIFSRCNLCDFYGLNALDADGRSIQLYGASGCNVYTTKVVNGGSTGLSLVYGSMNNEFHGVTALNCAHEGVWHNGRRNKRNKYFGVTSYGNGAEIAIPWRDIAISSTDTEVSFFGLDPRGVNNIFQADTFVQYTSGPERGTFTPDLKFGGANTGITYSTQLGKWEKVTPKVIVFEVNIILTSKGSATGAATITGFPFPLTGSVPTFTMWLLSGAGLTTQHLMPIMSGSDIHLRYMTAASQANMTDANFTNTTRVNISGTVML